MAFVYSCCFWFSLRLAGILIGLFSMLQSVALLMALSMAHVNLSTVHEQLSAWMQQTDLSFAKSTFENILNGLDSYITIGIALTSIYLVLCIVFVYGAYKCSNSLMLGYLVVELVRLMVASVLVVAWLMVLKKNTMDIGLLIGASIAGGFTLLGIFYLWVCTVNLPILINEMEREEHLETILQLQRQLEQRSQLQNYNVDMDELLPAFPVEPVLPVVYAPAGKNIDKNFPLRRNISGQRVNTITGHLGRNGYMIGSREFLQ